MKYIIDIDGTICTNTYGKYHDAVPFMDRIEYLNSLYDAGDEIHYWTARGSTSNIDWQTLTLSQLKEWGAKYTTAQTGKPSYDKWIDDKAFNSEVFFK